MESNKISPEEAQLFEEAIDHSDQVEEKQFTPLTPEQRFGKVILKQNLMLNVQ